MKKIILILTLTLTGCKNDKKPDTIVIGAEVEAQQEAVALASLSINFVFKTNEADVFKIMMNNIEVDELQKKNIHIFEEVAPSTGDDSIIADFNTNNMSRHIVFHLGNKNIKEVEIKSILIGYGENTYNLTTASDINKYLAFNKFIDRDSLTKTFKTKRVDGKLNPSFRIKNNLLNLLNRE